MDFSKLAQPIWKKLDRVSELEVGTPVTERMVEVIEELRDLLDLFTHSWND